MLWTRKIIASLQSRSTHCAWLHSCRQLQVEICVEYYSRKVTRERAMAHLLLAKSFLQSSQEDEMAGASGPTLSIRLCLKKRRWCTSNAQSLVSLFDSASRLR